jgi:hypothetical protein
MTNGDVLAGQNVALSVSTFFQRGNHAASHIIYVDDARSSLAYRDGIGSREMYSSFTQAATFGAISRLCVLASTCGATDHSSNSFS